MKLSIAERIVLMQILPTEGDYLTYKILQELKLDLGFDEKEVKEYNIAFDDGKMTWDVTKDQYKDIEIGDKASEIITESLKRLDKDKKINRSNFELYEKFIIKK